MKHRILMALTLTLGAVSLPCLGQELAKEVFKPAEETRPEVKKFSSEGKQMKPADAPARTERASAIANVQTYDWIVYNWIKCDADWNQRCEGQYDFQVPQGWQACKFLFTEHSRGGASTKWEWAPTQWYTNDVEDPDRFRAYVAWIGAYGNNNPFNQIRAWIQMDNVGVRLIPAWANNYQRYAAGCDMPAH